MTSHQVETRSHAGALLRNPAFRRGFFDWGAGQGVNHMTYCRRHSTPYVVSAHPKALPLGCHRTEQNLLDTPSLIREAELQRLEACLAQSKAHDQTQDRAENPNPKPTRRSPSTPLKPGSQHRQQSKPLTERMGLIGQGRPRVIRLSIASAALMSLLQSTAKPSHCLRWKSLISLCVAKQRVG